MLKLILFLLLLGAFALGMWYFFELASLKTNWAYAGYLGVPIFLLLFIKGVRRLWKDDL